MKLLRQQFEFQFYDPNGYPGFEGECYHCSFFKANHCPVTGGEWEVQIQRWHPDGEFPITYFGSAITTMNRIRQIFSDPRNDYVTSHWLDNVRIQPHEWFRSYPDVPPRSAREIRRPSLPDPKDDPDNRPKHLLEVGGPPPAPLTPPPPNYIFVNLRPMPFEGFTRPSKTAGVPIPKDPKASKIARFHRVAKPSLTAEPSSVAGPSTSAGSSRPSSRTSLATQLFPLKRSTLLTQLPRRTLSPPPSSPGAVSQALVTEPTSAALPPLGISPIQPIIRPEENAPQSSGRRSRSPLDKKKTDGKQKK